MLYGDDRSSAGSRRRRKCPVIIPAITYAAPVATITHAARKCSDRGQPAPKLTRRIGRSKKEGAPKPPTSPQYKRGCATRMARPLTNNAPTQAAVIQCPIRTKRGWRPARLWREDSSRHSPLTCDASVVVGSKGDGMPQTGAKRKPRALGGITTDYMGLRQKFYRWRTNGFDVE